MMQITRATDAEVVNMIVNDPSIYPFVHGQVEGPLDLTPIVANPANSVLIARHGAIIFTKHQDGIYEGHSQVLPSGRGEWAVELVHAAMQWQFTHTDAMEIWTRVPKGNLAARALTKLIGGKFQFRSERGWMMGNEVVWADIFSQTVQDWMAMAPGLQAIGEEFHTKLHIEYDRLGTAPFLAHADDPVHNRYVGAAAEMIRCGQPQKGVILYNRFADMAGYQRITLLRTDPVMIDMRDAVLEVHGRNFFIAQLLSTEVH